MKIKKIVGIAAVSIIIIVGAEVLGYFRAYEKINEEYIAVLTDNRDDFEYVARTMQQWESESLSIIYFNIHGWHTDFDDNVSIYNSEIESEISNNKKFYESLKNIYELNEISYIAVYSDTIAFNFSKPLRDRGYCSIIYGEDIKKCSCTHMINNEWALQVVPLYHTHDYYR